MSQSFDDKQPIFLQIKEKMEDQIVNKHLREHDQIPSTTQMVNFYKINHITISKGINLLVDEGILYKKRGIGMFVAEGARGRLLERRKDLFADHYVRPMIQEAKKLGLTEKEICVIIQKIKESDSDEF